jgi:uncharacterized protein (TIGR03000 family)
MPRADEVEALRKQIKSLQEQIKKMQGGGKDGKDGKDKKQEEEAQAPTGPAPARITVNLPADARLWVDQVECPLTSGVRAFNTPALQPGQTYFYTLRVQSQRNGTPVTDTQRVLLTAGANVTVTFTDSGAVATALR